MHQKLVFWMDTCISSLYSDVGCHSLYNCCSNESHRTVCSLKIVCIKPVFYCFIVKRLQIDFFVWLSMCNLVEMHQSVKPIVDRYVDWIMEYKPWLPRHLCSFCNSNKVSSFGILSGYVVKKKLEPTWQPQEN